MAQQINDECGDVFSNAINIGDVKGKNGESNLFYFEEKRRKNFIFKKI